MSRRPHTARRPGGSAASVQGMTPVRTGCSSQPQPALRFAWFHVPKTGSSIATSLFHRMNSSLPPRAQLPSCSGEGLLLASELPVDGDASSARLFRSICRQRRLRDGRNKTICEREPTQRCFQGQAELHFLRRFPLERWFKCARIFPA